jgi:NDP-sugar pyrophosphorylase family protein
MNIITKHPVNNLGYGFINEKYLPEGKDEYYLRNIQNKNGITYRALTSSEKEILIRNGNNSDDWSKILVSEAFDPGLVKNCKFFGLIRIGKLEPYYLEFHNLRMPVGIYNSTVISSDFGDNVCIDNASYLSHYIIGNEVMIANVNELATTDYSKFGNGILKDGEKESVRVWMELCNENGGRKVLPFDGMLPGDAFLWSKYVDDEKLQQRFIELTENKFDKKRGYYGTVGVRTVIKNCKIIKDVRIGSDAYLKGAYKIKNLTINSDEDRISQIGEGCELVNGIIGYGCRIFYGVKAVRFVMASHSQLKYGARLINSYVGNNSTISCCEVLNSLIFPAHEQHHNNSFLCASLVLGQSNIAAGATIGSNHNSRSADGEIVAGRGFWPGLCVSLKHNSKFATFTILAKADFPAELNIPIPFSLVSNDVSRDMLVLMPGYWFMYNMYALSRNTWKYQDRDKRTEKIQEIEYDYLAPDTVNELFDALKIMKRLKPDKQGNYFLEGLENSSRKTLINKLPEALSIFRDLIIYYGASQLMGHIKQNKITSFAEMKKSLPARISRSKWINVGGQLIQEEDIEKIKQQVKSGKIQSWDELHAAYRRTGDEYNSDKLLHAYTSLLEILNITSKQFTPDVFKNVLQDAVKIKEWMSKGIYDSREKDYTNPFRKMVYDNKKEMDKVIGKIEENAFIQEQLKDLDAFKKRTRDIIKKLQP